MERDPIQTLKDEASKRNDGAINTCDCGSGEPLGGCEKCTYKFKLNDLLRNIDSEIARAEYKENGGLEVATLLQAKATTLLGLATLTN